jgi:hypothetical protein
MGDVVRPYPARLGRAPLAMRDAVRLFVIVGKAALIVTAGAFALVWTSTQLGFDPNLKPVRGEILGALACFIPIGIATAWMLRKLLTVYPRREARAVTIAFGLFTPVSLLVSLILSEITGGYAEALAKQRFFGLIGAFVGCVVITAFLSFLVCALVLRVTRLAISVEQIE